MYLRVVRTKKYEKSLKKYYKANLINLEKLNSVINTIARREELSEKYRDHKLQGELKEFRECHVAPDILLIYRIEKEILVLMLMNIGSHSDLFG